MSGRQHGSGNVDIAVDQLRQIRDRSVSGVDEVYGAARREADRHVRAIVGYVVDEEKQVSDIDNSVGILVTHAGEGEGVVGGIVAQDGIGAEFIEVEDDEIGSDTGIQNVVAVAACQDIDILAADERVVAVAAVEEIKACAAFDVVVAIPAAEPVIAVTAFDDIVSRVAEDKSLPRPLSTLSLPAPALMELLRSLPLITSSKAEPRTASIL